ncbi:borealin-2 isoform X2 [Syngnathus scovelli]|uniref:borealin-2 isoform X2 n=1 Tax=Syngnathus scovelli TaxID=161590 RepID=UPI00210F8FB2|nr:borealin-2 isoform X2 [Syngnathus scovelli]
MAPRGSRNASKEKHQEELSRVFRGRKITLFIQQVEKEAQERMMELESRLDNTLANIDKVFKVELMKLPPSIRNMRFVDLTELSASEVSLAIQQQESPEMKQRTLERVPSTKGKSTPLQDSLTPKNSGRTLKVAKEARVRNLTASGMSTGNLRTLSSIKGGPLTKSSDRLTRRKLRSVVSTGELDCAVAGSAAHVTVTTGRGQTVSFSEATKDEINFDLLDEVALRRMQELSKLIEYVSGRGRCHR